MPNTSDLKRLSKIERDIAAAERNGDSSRVRELLMRKGHMELNASRPNDAIVSFSRASSVAGGENDLSCLRGLGDCFEEMGDFARALEHRQAHYSLAKKFHNIVEQQRALTCIGNAYYQLAIRKTESVTDLCKDPSVNSHEMTEVLCLKDDDVIFLPRLYRFCLFFDTAQSRALFPYSLSLPDCTDSAGLAV